MNYIINVNPHFQNQFPKALQPIFHREIATMEIKAALEICKPQGKSGGRRGGIGPKKDAGRGDKPQ
jgi:hypothetical protein